MYMYLRALGGTAIIGGIAWGMLGLGVEAYQMSTTCMPDQSCIEMVKLIFGMDSAYYWPYVPHQH